MPSSPRRPRVPRTLLRGGGARGTAARLGVVVAVLVATAAITLLPGGSPPARAQALVPYVSCEELLAHYRGELARTATAWGSGGDQAYTSFAGRGSRVGVPVPAAANLEAASPLSATADAVGAGPTGTNLQEQGVDEPDTAKLAGGVLYTLAQGRLQMVRAGDAPQLLGSYDLGEQSAGGELLVDGDRVLVLTTTWRPAPTEPTAGSGPDGGLDRILPSGGGSPLARLTLLDVSVPSAPQLLEELEVDGRYLSARLVDGTVRLVTASSPMLAGVQPGEPYGPAQEQAALEANRAAAASAPLSSVLPQLVRRGPDGEVLAEQPAVGCDRIRHASSPYGVSTLLVSTLRPGRGLEPLDSTGVTTDGDLVYASADRLYVATSRYGTVAPAGGPGTVTRTPDDVTTELHAFDTSGPDRTGYLGSGSVRGYVLGRWALSAHEGHLRVATTLQAPWSADAPSSSSSVAVLAERDGGLVETGRVDGLGPGERIYAVRYFGTLATVVTFRQTDPLYVLDLADVARPRLLGELKVPGFSTYLHPVGGDRLLGVGQEADASGRVTGMQVSLFDLSDRSAPTQLDRLQLGDGWSPALEDSRAFGYDPSRRQALLPFLGFSSGGPGPASPELIDTAPPPGLPDPSSPVGEALAVAVDEDGTLSLAGRLPGNGQGPPERVLHDADHVYAVGQQGVDVGTADGLRPTGSVRFLG